MPKCHSPAPQWTALQCAAALLLTRLAFFFCDDAPFTAARARGLLTAVILQTALTLPLYRIRLHRILPVFKIYAALLALLLTADFPAMLHALQMPHPAAVILLFTAALADALLLPQTAAPRCAVLLLTVTCAGFLLLIPRAAVHASLLTLYGQPGGAAAAFLREWRFAPLCLMPAVLPHSPDNRAFAKKAMSGFCIGRMLLAGLILLGAMCSGRLTVRQGNPFFLLLARLPFSDAVRTDGFWIMLSVSCVLLSTGFLIGTGKICRAGERSIP